MNEDLVKRSWCEVDLVQLEKNIDLCKSFLPRESEIMAVVKADAYGHGYENIVKTLHSYGVSHFAVSNINEAIDIRKMGIVSDILVLGYTPTEKAELLLKYDISQTILSEEYAIELSKACSGKIKCQFAIDTGMNRIGLDADNPTETERIIRIWSKRFNVTGMFTHLCVADMDDEDSKLFTINQINKFERIADSIKDLQLAYVHCLNSAGGLFYKSRYNKMIRLGIVMYGLKPDRHNVLPKGIKPIMTWKSVVSMIKEVNKGETISYGRTFTAIKKMKIATIPTGYADGYSRLLSNRGYVLINGAEAPIVGRICMDQFMVDVTHIENVNMGNEVVLLGRSGHKEITADDLAEMTETIGYEVVCGVSKRVPRVYI